MSVTCQDLLTLKYFERIKLVAGPNGLDRTVTWPYVGQTSTVSQWVHGGELLFITGIVHSADKLKDLILECIQKKLAGLVILVGNEYINSIPEELLAQADAADFPLFEMPWDVKLIDVTREITDLIMRDKFEIKKSKNFLCNRTCSTSIRLGTDNFLVLCSRYGFFELSPRLSPDKP